MMKQACRMQKFIGARVPLIFRFGILHSAFGIFYLCPSALVCG